VSDDDDGNWSSNGEPLPATLPEAVTTHDNSAAPAGELPSAGETSAPARPLEVSGDVEGLTITEAASAFGVSVSTLRRRIAAGDIVGASLVPGPKGQEYRVPPASLEALGYKPKETRAAEAVKAARAGLEAEVLESRVRELEAALEVERLRREAAEGRAETLEGNVSDLRSNNATLQAALTDAISKIPALPPGPPPKPPRWWRRKITPL
jgi:hypothetical protein